MAKVLILPQRDRIGLNADRLDALYAQLGDAAADEVICRAMEELALRLTRADRHYRDGALAEMRKSVRSLVAIADQIGMDSLAAVARDVTRLIDRSLEGADGVALAAVLARLMRVGERSLTEVWDLQDLSL